jgi:hypothetical protein
MMAPLVATSTKINHANRKIYIKSDDRIILDALTIYHPVNRQCDSTPLITACNSKINVDDLHSQRVRWMALSRDLLKRWKGKFSYGDTVLVTAGDPEIDGFLIIKDTMNKRYKNRGDLLFHSEVRKSGKWNSVELSKVTWLTL